MEPLCPQEAERSQHCSTCLGTTSKRPSPLHQLSSGAAGGDPLQSHEASAASRVGAGVGVCPWEDAGHFATPPLPLGCVSAEGIAIRCREGLRLCWMGGVAWQSAVSTGIHLRSGPWLCRGMPGTVPQFPSVRGG